MALSLPVVDAHSAPGQGLPALFIVLSSWRREPAKPATRIPHLHVSTSMVSGAVNFDAAKLTLVRGG